MGRGGLVWSGIKVSFDTGADGPEPASAPAEHRLPRPVRASKRRLQRPQCTPPTQPAPGAGVAGTTHWCL